MKRRKGYQVKNGHRQNFTMVKIEKFKKSTATKKTTTTKKGKYYQRKNTAAKIQQKKRVNNGT